MACCLKAPSPYLNRCWLTINKVQWHSSGGDFTSDTSAITRLSKISLKSCNWQWVSVLQHGWQNRKIKKYPLWYYLLWSILCTYQIFLSAHQVKPRYCGFHMSHHWGQMTHICVGKLIIFGSDNGLSSGQRQAIILGRNFSEILNEIKTFLLKKICLKMPSAKCCLFRLGLNVLTYWGQATHICVGKLTIIGSDNGLLPGRHQAIFWTIAGILLIGPFVTNFSEIIIGIQAFSFKKMHFKTSSAK